MNEFLFLQGSNFTISSSLKYTENPTTPVPLKQGENHPNVRTIEARSGLL
jgi:hypothetical protein